MCCICYVLKYLMYESEHEADNWLCNHYYQLHWNHFMDYLVKCTELQ